MMGSEGFGGKIYGPSSLPRITRIEPFRWEVASGGIHSTLPVSASEDHECLPLETRSKSTWMRNVSARCVGIQDEWI